MFDWSYGNRLFEQKKEKSEIEEKGMQDFWYKIIVRIRIAEGGFRSRFLSDINIKKVLFFVFVGMFLTGSVLLGANLYTTQQDKEKLDRQLQDLAQLKSEALQSAIEDQKAKPKNEKSIADTVSDIAKKNSEDKKEATTVTQSEPQEVYAKNGMLAEYAPLYEKNTDMIGWLSVEGTVIDYPVMQTPKDEEFYLRKDFYKKDNENGSLIMDTDAVVGKGNEKKGYEEGQKPSSNLIIHGHTMKTGAMFGTLERYKQETYGKEHKIIRFDSLYEKREYELIAMFYSKVYKDNEKVFKYYKFFHADTPGEFDNWYTNIKKLSIYDTGVTAEFGDEFITLSCCAYPSEDKRFVVIGKRIK